MKKQLRFFFTMFSTSATLPSPLVSVVDTHPVTGLAKLVKYVEFTKLWIKSYNIVPKCIQVKSTSLWYPQKVSLKICPQKNWLYLVPDLCKFYDLQISLSSSWSSWGLHQQANVGNSRWWILCIISCTDHVQTFIPWTNVKMTLFYYIISIYFWE